MSWSSGSSPDARRTAAVIVAGGSGRRMGEQGHGTPKQYRDLLGEPLLLWSVRTFVRHPRVAEVVVVLPARDAARPPEWLAALPVRVAAGGAERTDSVRNGLRALAGATDLVLIHDAARPLVSAEVIDRVIGAVGDGGAIAALPVSDTVKEAAPDGGVVRTLDRDGLWQAQTPQGFVLARIREIHRRAEADGVVATDDAALCERYGLPVRVVEGAPENLKVTRAADLVMVEALARRLRP